MPFDPTTAQPVPFDPTTARPTVAAPVKTSQTLGFEQGVGNFLGNIASAAGSIPGVAPAFQALTGHSLDESTDALRNPAHAPDEAPGKIGRFGADMLETVPLAGLSAVPLVGPALAAATGGGLTADPGHQVEGAALGAAGGQALHSLGGIISPVVAPAVKVLRAAGVNNLTPGQILGGVVKGVEDRVAGLPFIGDIVKNAQRESLNSFNAAAVNRALAPIGESLPRGVVGQDAIALAGDKLSGAYSALLPQMSTTLDGPFAADIASAGQRVAARLPDQMNRQFGSTVSDTFRKLGSEASQPSNTFSGAAAHEAASDLGASARSYQPLGGDQAELGRAFSAVGDAFRKATARSNPQLAPQLQAIDRGWANLVPVERAAAGAGGDASGKAAGVFTPHQLRTAVRMGDSTVRDRATARGESLMQDLAEAGIQRLPSSVPDSGTAGRALLGSLFGGAAGGYVHPAAGAAIAAAPFVYNQPVLRGLNYAFAREAGPAATALGDLFRTLAPISGPLTNGAAK
jgi:hypothetical protein